MTTYDAYRGHTQVGLGGIALAATAARRSQSLSTDIITEKERDREMHLRLL